MVDDNMRMASFRIDKDLWAKFGAISKRERYTVTEALTDYIQICTDNDRLELSSNTSNDATNNEVVLTDNDSVMTMVNTAIDEALSVFIDKHELINEQLVKAQIEPLADLLAELDLRTQSQLDDLRTELKKPLAIAR